MNTENAMTATMTTIAIEMDQKARRSGEEFLASSRKVPADLRDCIAGWSGKPWPEAKAMSQSDLADHVMRFLIQARHAWEQRSLDRQSMALWSDFGKRVASALSGSSLEGCAVQCRARADHDAAMGQTAPEHRKVLGYVCWSEPHTHGGKSRWLEIQLNSPREKADIVDPIPDVSAKAIEPDLSDRANVGLTVRFTEPRAVGTQDQREPSIDLESERIARLGQKVTERDDRIERLRLDLTLASAELADALAMLAIVRRERDELAYQRETLMAARDAAMAIKPRPRKTRKTA